MNNTLWAPHFRALWLCLGKVADQWFLECDLRFSGRTCGRNSCVARLYLTDLYGFGVWRWLWGWTLTLSPCGWGMPDLGITVTKHAWRPGIANVRTGCEKHDCWKHVAENYLVLHLPLCWRRVPPCLVPGVSLPTHVPRSLIKISFLQTNFQFQIH